MFVIKNYNRFLIGTPESYRWDDFFIHRFNADYKRLVKFDSREDCQNFINEHPEIEMDFDAWVTETKPGDWN